MAVDLGGTNLRVCSVHLHGDTSHTVQQSQLPIPRELMIGETPHALFSFIAQRIQDFLGTFHQLSLEAARDDPNRAFFSLGFTFSFPAYQNAINSGVLLHWTKGFDIPGALGKDVCHLLQVEIDLLKLPVKVTALVNDAVGTIMSRAYALPLSHVRPSVGAIFGTGTNGVYLQDLSDITKPLDGEYDQSTGKMFISTEWGGFDNKLSVLPVSPYDADLDKHSVNPGGQMFEKRVSGMFLGELLRLASLAMYCDENIRLFRASTSASATTAIDLSIPLQTRWTVDSSILSVAEADTSQNLSTLRQKIHESFGIREENIGVEDAAAVKVVAHAIGARAGRLGGTAIGAIILQGRLLGTTDAAPPGHGEGFVDAAVDGSVIEHYPGFKLHMREALSAIPQIGNTGEKRIRIGHAKDGSSVGAAIVALLAAERA